MSRNMSYNVQKKFFFVHLNIFLYLSLVFLTIDSRSVRNALFSGFLLVKVKRYQRVCVIGHLRQNAVPLIDGLILYKLV